MIYLPMISPAGVFVDIGVNYNHVFHVSHLANQFVKNPAEVVKSVSMRRFEFLR